MSSTEEGPYRDKDIERIARLTLIGRIRQSVGRVDKDRTLERGDQAIADAGQRLGNTFLGRHALSALDFDGEGQIGQPTETETADLGVTGAEPALPPPIPLFSRRPKPRYNAPPEGYMPPDQAS